MVSYTSVFRYSTLSKMCKMRKCIFGCSQYLVWNVYLPNGVPPSASIGSRNWTSPQWQVLAAITLRVDAVITRLRPISQFTDTSYTNTFGVFCNRYWYKKLFDDNVRWLIQRSLCWHACFTCALGHVLIRILLNYYFMLLMWSHQLSQMGVASSLKFDKSAQKMFMTCLWYQCWYWLKNHRYRRVTSTRCQYLSELSDYWRWSSVTTRNTASFA